MTACSFFSSMMRIQVNYTVSAIKEIVETHVAEKLYHNYSEGIIEKAKIRFHYTTKTVSKITMKLMN